jgi:pilus assembly protein FimV
LSNNKGEGDRVRKSLLKRLAIRLGCQKQKTTAKSLVILKLFAIVAALALSTPIYAVGMGGINVASSLGQQLKAEIDLMAVDKSEKDSLVARLSSPEAYKSAGLDYPYGNKFKFEIQSRSNGEQYIKVSSAQAINDPFVSLLVELSWSAGRLSREYTFLLDPVGYVPVQSAQAAVQVVAPAVQTTAPPLPSSATSVLPEEAAATPAEQAIPLTAMAPVEQVPMEQAAASAVPAMPAEATTTTLERAVPEEAEAIPYETAA